MTWSEWGNSVRLVLPNCRFTRIIRNRARLFVEWWTDLQSDSFLSKVNGVIHVGANVGQERHTYQRHGLNVLWIEPIPRVFNVLVENIRAYKTQRAINALIADSDGITQTFHIASNDGVSSSLFQLAKHSDIWPEVLFEESICLTSTTLDSLLEREKIDFASYEGLVIDTQGAELLVLKGANQTLRSMKYVQIEAADFEAYEGACELIDIQIFMRKLGFEEISREKFAEHPVQGAYYNVLYVRGEQPLR